MPYNICVLFLGCWLTSLVETVQTKMWQVFPRDDKVLSAEASVSLTSICLSPLTSICLSLFFSFF